MTTQTNMGSPIKVSVETFYVEAQSQPEKDKYVFAYTITIKNHSLCNTKLHSRYWLITDANGKVQEVNGDGVVGEQPHLDPGEEFEYSSGAVLETPVGAMQGLYRMETEGGFEFDAPIAPFTLAVPGMLN